MKLGEVANAGAARYGKPLEGIRVLALEQMQALPYATMLLSRLGAEVVKVEHPIDGDSGRSAQPFLTDASGRRAGATFLRNGLGKRSIGIDLKAPAGRDLVLSLTPHFDIFAENFKAGSLAKLGLSYADVAAVHPGIIYLSVSGFGNLAESPYSHWPAYASIAEAMAGLYEHNREGDNPPVVGPAGALGDTGSAMFGTIGVLAALLHRARTGEGQHVDISMYDAMIAMTDVIMNLWSMGMRGMRFPPIIVDGFRARDGWFILQVGREHQFERLAHLVGKPAWLTDPRLQSRASWREHLETDIRPAVESWASQMSKLDACVQLADAGLAAGPCNGPEDVLADPHVAMRHMLVELERNDGVDGPILVPGNPVKLSKMAEGPETFPPLIGEDTDSILRSDLGLDDSAIARLRADGVVS